MAVLAIALLVTVTALPAQADSPVQFEEPFFNLRADVENGVAVFWNITRDDFCAWEAGGFAGAPPVIELVSVSSHETGKGALVGSFQAERPIELWNLDDDVPPLVSACADTDDQTEPWATGVASVISNDNDIDISGTRTNSFGERGRGTVEDGDGGRWHYSWMFRATCTVDCGDDFSLKVENANLVKQGH